MGVLSSLSKMINVRTIRKDLETLNNLVGDSINNIISLLSFKQNTSEKNQNGGYLGLDSNGRFNHYEFMTQNEQWHYNAFISTKDRGINGDYLSTVNGTGASANTNGTISINANKSIQKPTLTVNANAGANYSTYMYYNLGNIKLGDMTVILDSSIFFNLNSQILDSAFFFGLHTATAQNTTGSQGTGILFRRNPSLNSGKWSIIKITSGTINLTINTNIAFNDLTKPRLKIIYNKLTEIAYFYIDNILVHTENNVNLPNTNFYHAYWCFSQGGVNDPLIKVIAPFDLLIGLKNVV